MKTSRIFHHSTKSRKKISDSFRFRWHLSLSASGAVTYFIVLNDGADDEFEDAESDGLFVRFSPQQALGLDLANFRLHGTQVRLVIPRLHVQDHVRLSDQGWLLRLEVEDTTSKNNS